MPATASATSSAPSRRDCVLLLAAALMTSCTLEPGAGQSAAGTEESGWHLTLEQSGGIAGVHKRFTLGSSSDLLVVEDLRRASRIERPLTGDELKELATLVAARDSATAAPSPGRACPDCFEFTITTADPAKPRSAHYDSRTLAGSPDEALINRILELAAQAPAPH